MTKARQVLEVLASGSFSARQIAEKTGLSIPDVQVAIRTLRRNERVASVAVPVHYTATDDGVKALKRKPLPKKLLERKRRERHAREKRAETLVGKAINNQPTLATVWGRA